MVYRSMFYVSKRVEVAGAHRLTLDYESKCQSTHGHNWIVTVHCRAAELNGNGMVVDFAHIKAIVSSLDHKYLNDILCFNPTAENIARHICENVPNCYKVQVQESEGNCAEYVLQDQ